MLSTRRLNTSLLCGILCAVVDHGTVRAQAPSQSAIDIGTPPAMAVGRPAGTYALSDFESVNLFNGGWATAAPSGSAPTTFHATINPNVH